MKSGGGVNTTTSSSLAEQVGLFGKWGPPCKEVLRTNTQLVWRQADAGPRIQIEGSTGQHHRRGLCGLINAASCKALEPVWEVIQ